MTQSFLPGQHIKVERPFYWHHGIYLGWQHGRQVVAELAKPQDGGIVRIVDLETFAGGGQVTVVPHTDGVPLEQVVRNVLAAQQWPRYDLLNWNCEHFANWCSTHQSRSFQVEGVAAAALLVLGLLFLGKLAA